MAEPSGKSSGPQWHKPRLPPLPDTECVRAGRAVVERLKGAGHEAYFVGGFVRNWLLGIEHLDVDIATSAHPEVVQELFEKTRAVGAHFGVVLVELKGQSVEVATFRTDLAYKDSRRPEGVEYGTLEQDAERRDFTVNALYYDPVEEKLVDLVQGRLDLRRRMLRTVGPAATRFQEDALRLMRAIRFAAHYELEVEDGTRKAFRVRAKNLDNISKERIGEELIKIFSGPNRGRSMRLMHDLKVWPHVIPEVEEMIGCEQGPRAHPEGDVFTHTALALDHLPDNPSAALAIATLLHDIGKPRTRTRNDRIHFYNHQHVGAEMAREICARLKFSGDLTGQIVHLVERHMDFLQVLDMRPAKIKRFVGREDFQLHLQLHRADSLASDGDLTSYEYCVEQRKRLKEEYGHALLPEPLATGHDLIELGLEPGPSFSDILDALHDEQLEGRVKTAEDASAFLKARVDEIKND